MGVQISSDTHSFFFSLHVTYLLVINKNKMKEKIAEEINNEIYHISECQRSQIPSDTERYMNKLVDFYLMEIMLTTKICFG